jgi:hypothetical protein
MCYRKIFEETERGDKLNRLGSLRNIVQIYDASCLSALSRRDAAPRQHRV